MPQRLTGTYLIVDDEESMRCLLEAALGASGAEVVCAANAQEALEQLREGRERIRGILLDLNLQDIPGEQLYDQLMEIAPGVAVFPMSGCCGEEIQDRIGKRPVASIVAKPFVVSKLVETIAACLDPARDAGRYSGQGV